LASVGQQVPFRIGWSHDTQAPWQATLQQTPSAQNPEMQSLLPRGQGSPPLRLPQLPPEQAWPAEHIAAVVQASKQAPLLGSQVYG
jgi:hypothetical protein